jgi:hypothetical protein
MTPTISSVHLVSACLALAPLAGCTQSCDRAQALWLDVKVIDALDGGRIPSAQVNGLPCGGGCSLHSYPDGGPASAGTVDLTVTADHYQALTVTVVVPATTPVDQGCCGMSPPWIGEHWTIPLYPR